MNREEFLRIWDKSLREGPIDFEDKSIKRIIKEIIKYSSDMETLKEKLKKYNDFQVGFAFGIMIGRWLERSKG